MTPANEAAVAVDNIGGGTSVSNDHQQQQLVHHRRYHRQQQRLYHRHIRSEDDFEQDGIEFMAAYSGKETSATEAPPKFIEKSVIIHRDENGFGLRVKGQAPVFVEHVHENGAAWRAGVRRLDRISKVNGTPVSNMEHKDVVLMFKGCSRFVGLSLLSAVSANCGAAQLAAFYQPQPQQYSCNISNFAGGARGPGSLVSRNSFIGSIPLGSSAATSTATLGQPSARLSSVMAGVKGAGDHSPAHGSFRSEHRQHHYHQHHHHHLNSQSYSLLPNGYTATTIAAANSKLTASPRSTYSTDNQASIPFGASPIRQNSAYEKQSAAARRSESVSLRPSYLASGKQQVTSGELGRQQQARVERRISAGEPSAYQLEAHCSDNNRIVMTMVCINCRTALNQGEQDSGSARMAAVGPGGNDSIQLTCVQCQQSFDSSMAEQRARHSLTTDSPQKGKLAEHQRQRFFASLRQRDVRQQNAAAAANLDGPGGAPDPSQSSAQQSAAGTFYKLSQSASANSLPVETIRHHNSPAARRPINKRLEIIREFIDTEKTHTDRLRCLDELFYRPLKAGNFMTSEQLRLVFSCHRTLYKIHRQIYRILLSANYNLYAEPLIGSALLEIFEGDLKRRLERASCSFCAAQSTNVDLLNKLTRRDTKVGEFLAQVTSQQMVGRLGIKDLLASCFQRLTKYPLLLENLLKATPQSLPLLTRSVKRTKKSPHDQPPDGTQQDDNSGPGERQKAAAAANDGDLEDDELAMVAGGDGGEDADNDDDDDDNGGSGEAEEEEDEEEEELEEERNSRRMLAISLAEEREFIERALHQSRQILIRVNESVKVAMSHNKLKEIWKRTDKYPGVPLIDITKQQVVHEGLLTLRLAKRSFDVYVLLLNDYIIILTREGQDKYRLKFFTPEGKSSNNPQSVYSPVFVIDEHLTTRDAATDENGFYLLCKRKDDSRIYEFASRSPAERLKWRDRIQWTIERQMSKGNRRPSCESTITKSSSEISARQETDELSDQAKVPVASTGSNLPIGQAKSQVSIEDKKNDGEHSAASATNSTEKSPSNTSGSGEPTKIEGTISYVEDDGIVMPSKMESSRALVDQAIQVNISTC